MRALVIGAKGMLGTDLLDVAIAKGIRAQGFDLPEVDVLEYANLMENLPSADCIVNCAAYTRVDDAEKERDVAFAVNSEGVRNLARISLKRQVPILHISTDYVFDGRQSRAYEEKDRTNPLNIYGASKMAGERMLRATGCPSLIVRTQSLFGKNGPNFVKAIVRKLKEGDAPLTVVDDQISAPTYTRHLAEALVKLMEKRPDGILHVTASGQCSWFEFAQAIVERIKPGHEVQPIKTKDLQRPALRPMNSVLSLQRFTALTGHVMPTWKEGLDAYLKEENYFK